MCISEISELRFGASKVSLSSGLETERYSYEVNDLCFIAGTKGSYL
jgi:hypothetical protein